VGSLGTPTHHACESGREVERSSVTTLAVSSRRALSLSRAGTGSCAGLWRRAQSGEPAWALVQDELPNRVDAIHQRAQVGELRPKAPCDLVSALAPWRDEAEDAAGGEAARDVEVEPRVLSQHAPRLRLPRHQPALVNSFRLRSRHTKDWRVGGVFLGALVRPASIEDGDDRCARANGRRRSHGAEPSSASCRSARWSARRHRVAATRLALFGQHR